MIKRIKGYVGTGDMNSLDQLREEVLSDARMYQALRKECRLPDLDWSLRAAAKATELSALEICRDREQDFDAIMDKQIERLAKIETPRDMTRADALPSLTLIETMFARLELLPDIWALQLAKMQYGAALLNSRELATPDTLVGHETIFTGLDQLASRLVATPEGNNASGNASVASLRGVISDTLIWEQIEQALQKDDLSSITQSIHLMLASMSELARRLDDFDLANARENAVVKAADVLSVTSAICDDPDEMFVNSVISSQGSCENVFGMLTEDNHEWMCVYIQEFFQTGLSAAWLADQHDITRSR